MKTIVIVGGNSGIGLESARALTRRGHSVVLVGRDRVKGDEAAASLGGNAGRATFVAADVSTHDGVRALADRLLADHPTLDGVLHTSGVLTFDDVRTADGLHPFFAVNFLSRYHLTQRLLPAIRRAAGFVVMVTSKVPLNSEFHFEGFPRYQPWAFRKMTMRIQIGNHHYASALRDREPTLRAAVVNAGVVRTGIWRVTPWYVKIMSATLGPLLFDSVEQAAVNPVALCVDDRWRSGIWLEKVGVPDAVTPLRLDPEHTARVMDLCRGLVGV